MARVRMTALLLMGLVMAIVGCAPQSQVIEFRTGRSQIRDLVRTAAVLPNGTPVFERLDTNYGFAGEVFHIEGGYLASNGSQRDGFLDLGFGVVDGDLSLTIVDHDVAGLDDHLSPLEQALTAELGRSIQGSFSEEILEFRTVEILADNVMEVSFQLDRPVAVH